jgi:hypothetical protein
MSQPCSKLAYMVFSLTVLLLAAGIKPAAARPRDDAMAGAYRCSAIGSSRLWLDCYYGVAQPVRALLGLPPVPEAQSRLASSPPAGIPQDQDVRDTVIREASRCDGNERDWLDCYYSAAQPMRLLLGLAPARQAARPPVRMSASSPVAGLPAGNWFLGTSKGIKARLSAYSLAKDGRFTVTLADGRVWRQTDGDVKHPDWKKPAQSYVVTISRGALGSTNLSVQGEAGRYKVEPG